MRMRISSEVLDYSARAQRVSLYSPSSVGFVTSAGSPSFSQPTLFKHCSPQLSLSLKFGTCRYSFLRMSFPFPTVCLYRVNRTSSFSTHVRNVNSSRVPHPHAMRFSSQVSVKDCERGVCERTPTSSCRDCDKQISLSRSRERFITAQRIAELPAVHHVTHISLPIHSEHEQEKDSLVVDAQRVADKRSARDAKANPSRPSASPLSPICITFAIRHTILHQCEY